MQYGKLRQFLELLEEIVNEECPVEEKKGHLKDAIKREEQGGNLSEFLAWFDADEFNE